jgi:Zn-dependent peptidase ImmA (M78 family)/transcriptional regulator with XRE-family HTH domain
MTSAPQGPKNIFLGSAPAFQGERLKQAREAQGLTMTTLAERIGKSKQTISRYESDTDKPPLEVVQMLARTLDQPLQFFYQPLRNDELYRVTFFRRLKRITGPELRRAAAWQRFLEDLVLFLEDYISFTPLNLPSEFLTPTHAEDVDLNVIEEVASRLRRHWRLGHGPIDNLAQVVEFNGFLVTRFDIGADDIDGYSFTASSGRRVVALSDYKTNYFRSRFDLAHEVAHHIFHSEATQQDLDNVQTYERMEKQAHRFAGAFLLPTNSLLQDASSIDLDSLLLLKQKWGVSIGAIIYRLSDLGVIDHDTFVRLRKTLVRRKWNRREPLDFSTDPEMPIAIRQAIQALMTDANFTKQDILSDTVRAPEAIRRVAALPLDFFKNPDEVKIELKKENLKLFTG